MQLHTGFTSAPATQKASPRHEVDALADHFVLQQACIISHLRCMNFTVIGSQNRFARWRRRSESATTLRTVCARTRMRSPSLAPSISRRFELRHIAAVCLRSHPTVLDNPRKCEIAAEFRDHHQRLPYESIPVDPPASRLQTSSSRSLHRKLSPRLRLFHKL